MTKIAHPMPQNSNFSGMQLNQDDRFRELVDFLPEIVFEVDNQGTVIFVNKHGLDLLGYTHEDVE